MTREEATRHWAEAVIPAVFRAEDKLRPQLKRIIADHKDDHDKGASLYCRLIAEEILSRTTDEELERMTEV